MNIETTSHAFLTVQSGYFFIVFYQDFYQCFPTASRLFTMQMQQFCSLGWEQQSHYPCSAFFTLVVHRKTDLITESTNWGWMDTWLLVLKAMIDIIRRSKLHLLLLDAFASDLLCFGAAYCLWRSVCYSSLHGYSCCGWHLRSVSGGFEWDFESQRFSLLFLRLYFYFP